MTDEFAFELKRSVSEIRNQHPELQPDQAFIYWFMQAFITEESNAVKNALVGGSNDKNIDAIYIDDAVRSVYVIQGKYRTNVNKTENRSDLIAFSKVADFLLGSSEKFKTIMSNAEISMQPILKNVRSALMNKKYQLALQYVTTGRISAQHADEAEEHAVEYENTTYQTFDNKSLRRLMQDYIDGAAPPIPTVKLRIEGNEAFDSYDEKTGVTSWVFAMNGRELGELFNKHGVRIFARNIRGFLGKRTSVNKSMVSTIENSPELFWYYNNGATIICDHAKQIREQGKQFLNVTNAQIINGQQTTRTLAELNDSEKVKVLVRVNVVKRAEERDFTHYSQLVSEIVKATNSQNAIKPSDLISNDAEQIRIERELRKLDYFYARKAMTKGEMRAHYGARHRQIIKRDDLVMAIASCTVDPSVVRRGKQQFFVSPYYEKLFNGQNIYFFLTIYWIYMYSKYIYKGRGPEIGYSRHVVNYQLWNDIGAKLNRKSRAVNFINSARKRKYDLLDDLGSMIEVLIREAMQCYKRNNKYQIIDDNGKDRVGRYAEIDYFKRGSVLNDWKSHWKHDASNSSNDKYKRAQNRLISLLDELDI